jgi:hypothetical protein
MNASIEHGIAEWLRGRLQGADVREATSAIILPGDRQAVIVECSECEHLAGNLHKATVRITTATPAHDHSTESHRSLSASVAALFASASGLPDAFLAATGWESRGHFLRSQSEAREESSWLSTAEVVLGLAVPVAN